MKLLVSACLLGVACRYDGASKGLPDSVLRELMARHVLVPACPEQLGGLPTPRAPSERLGSRVVARTGADVTDAYTRGAQQTLALAQLLVDRFLSVSLGVWRLRGSERRSCLHVAMHA